MIRSIAKHSKEFTAAVVAEKTSPIALALIEKYEASFTPPPRLPTVRLLPLEFLD